MKRRSIVAIIITLLFAIATNFMVIEAVAQTEVKRIYIQVSQNNAGEIISVKAIGTHANEYDVAYTTDYSEIGEKPALTVTATAKDGYVFYNDFATKSQFSISGGNFLSGYRVNVSSVKVQIEGSKRVRGKLDAPKGLSWEDNYLATWNEVIDADYYVVNINGNNVTIYNNEADLRQFLKENKNNKFRVKACSNNSYSLDSVWSEYSDELYYERDYWDDSYYDDYWYDDGWYDGWYNDNYYQPQYNYNSNNLQNGWSKVGDTWYYYVGGAKVTDAIYNVDGRSYLFDKTGRMLTGWQSYRGSTYYFYPQGNTIVKEGEMARGWALIEGKWYFYDRNTGKEVHDRIVEGYYVGSGGNMVTNQWIGDKYVDESGRILSNCWKLINWRGQTKWFYFESNGDCVKGRISVINGLPYPFDGYGALIYGWFNYNGNSYYVKPDGNIARNENINGYWVDSYGRWKWY